MKFFSRRPVISPPCCWQVLLGPQQIKNRSVCMTFNTHVHCVHSRKRRGGQVSGNALCVATLPMLRDQVFNASVLPIAPQACFLSTRCIQMTTSRLYDMSAGQFTYFISCKCFHQKTTIFTKPWEGLPFFAETTSAVTVFSQIFATYLQGNRRHRCPSAEVLASKVLKTADELVSSADLPAVLSFPIMESSSLQATTLTGSQHMQLWNFCCPFLSFISVVSNEQWCPSFFMPHALPDTNVPL